MVYCLAKRGRLYAIWASLRLAVTVFWRRCRAFVFGVFLGTDLLTDLLKSNPMTFGEEADLLKSNRLGKAVAVQR